MVYVATHFFFANLFVAGSMTSFVYSTGKNVRKYLMNEFSFKRCALESMRCAPGIVRTLGSTFQPPFFHIFTSSFHFLVVVRIIFLFFNFLFLILQLIIFFKHPCLSFIFFSNFISSLFPNCYFYGNLPCFSCFYFLLPLFLLHSLHLHLLPFFYPSWPHSLQSLLQSLFSAE